jgi:hypothetical protein
MKRTRHRKSNRKSDRRSAKSRPAVEPDTAKRDAVTGRFGKGNSIARKADGINRFIKRQELSDDIRTEVERFTAQVISDQGGPSELTAIHGGCIRNLTAVETLVQLGLKDIRVNGMYTEKGRTRQIVFTLMQFLDRWDRYAQRLGMERRQKSIASLEAFLQQEGTQE